MPLEKATEVKAIVNNMQFLLTGATKQVQFQHKGTHR